MTGGAQVKENPTIGHETMEKAKPVAVDPSTQDEARRERQSKYITNNEALQLFRKLQEKTGEKLPEIKSSKGELLQLVELPDGSFFLSLNRGTTEYRFNKHGTYTHGKELFGNPSKEAKYGIKSQELLKEIKIYLTNWTRVL